MALGGLRKITAGLIAIGFALQLAGCGTLLYPERRGQVSGQYDTDIVLLDAAGLLFGIVPGVVAFAVDITTGAIYLPEGQTSRTRAILGNVEIERVPFEGRTLDDVEAALLEHSGIEVDLRAPGVQLTPMDDVADIEARLIALNRPWFAEAPTRPHTRFR